MISIETYKKLDALLEQAIALLPQELIQESESDLQLATQIWKLRVKIAKLEKSAARKEKKPSQ